jgi:hypothetical protein
VVKLYSRYRYKPSLPSWYPPLPVYQSLLLRLRNLGLFNDEHEDFSREMSEKKAARGKAPPKKGWWNKIFLCLSQCCFFCRSGETIQEEKIDFAPWTSHPVHQNSLPFTMQTACPIILLSIHCSMDAL